MDPYSRPLFPHILLSNFNSLLGRGEVVSVLAFCYNDPNSNRAEAYSFSLKFELEKNENKQNEAAGVAPSLTLTVNVLTYPGFLVGCDLEGRALVVELRREDGRKAGVHPVSELQQVNGQQGKDLKTVANLINIFTIVNYDSSVVIWCIFKSGATLKS